jgi:hypothetical protein
MSGVMRIVQRRVHMCPVIVLLCRCFCGLQQRHTYVGASWDNRNTTAALHAAIDSTSR